MFQHRDCSDESTEIYITNWLCLHLANNVFDIVSSEHDEYFLGTRLEIKAKASIIILHLPVKNMTGQMNFKGNVAPELRKCNPQNGVKLTHQYKQQ